jgi:transposase
MYTLEDAHRWHAMQRDGMTIEAISLETGVSPETVGRWLRKLPDYVPHTSVGGKPLHGLTSRGKPGSKIAKTTLYPARGHRRRGRL